MKKVWENSELLFLFKKNYLNLPLSVSSFHFIWITKISFYSNELIFRYFKSFFYFGLTVIEYFNWIGQINSEINSYFYCMFCDFFWGDKFITEEPFCECVNESYYISIITAISSTRNVNSLTPTWWGVSPRRIFYVIKLSITLKAMLFFFWFINFQYCICEIPTS